jgi:hypothetical protein
MVFFAPVVECSSKEGKERIRQRKKVSRKISYMVVGMTFYYIAIHTQETQVDCCGNREALSNAKGGSFLYKNKCIDIGVISGSTCSRRTPIAFCLLSCCLCWWFSNCSFLRSPVRCCRLCFACHSSSSNAGSS